MQALYPYDNTLRAVRITGASCASTSSTARATTATDAERARRRVDPTVPGYNFDIVAGADYVLDVVAPVGPARHAARGASGRPVAPTDSFTLALNNYRQTGGGGYAMLPARRWCTTSSRRSASC